MTLAAARNRRTPADSTVTAPTVRASQAFSANGPGLTGDRTYTLSTVPLVGSSLLVVFAERFGLVAGVNAGGGALGWVYSREPSSNAFEEAGIGWGDVTVATATVTVHYHASAGTDAAMFRVYEITGLAGKTILSSTTAANHSHVSAGGTISTSVTATAPGQLVVGAFASHNDENIDPTWTESPAGAWTRLREAGNSVLTASFGLSGAAGLHTITRDYPSSGPGMDSIAAAALIG